jgi:excisionase family DNA binding protein
MDTEIQEQLKRIEKHLNDQGILNKEVLCFQEAATYLSVSKSQLYKLTSTNRIPFYKPTGKMVYFRRTELDSWLLANRFDTIDEIKSKVDLMYKEGRVKR